MAKEASSSPSLGRFFQRYFILIILLWILLVLYHNPVSLITSLGRAMNPPVDPDSVGLLLQQLGTDPATIEWEVLERIPYRYDWEVHDMPWYFPTVGEILQRGEGDCKARALLLASVFEAEGIPYRIDFSPTHMWVEYKGKEQTSLENPEVKFYQHDPETGERLLQFPDIPFSDIVDTSRESLWDPMPLGRKALLISGLLALVIVRLTLFWKTKGN
jgi:hypothetical protein